LKIEMRVIAKRTLRVFWSSEPKYDDSHGPLEAWHEEVLKVNWAKPQDVKKQFGNASILKTVALYSILKAMTTGW